MSAAVSTARARPPDAVMAATRSTVVGAAAPLWRAAVSTPNARLVKLWSGSSPGLLDTPAEVPPSSWEAATASASACWHTAETGMPAALTSMASSSGR